MIVSGGEQNLSHLWQLTPDLLIYCVGYEARSSALSTALALAAHKVTRLGFVFERNRVLSFARNLTSAQELGCTLEPATAEHLRNECIKAVKGLSATHDVLTVLLDISSMTRELMATAVMALGRSLRSTDRLIIGYCPQTYREPKDTSLPIAGLGPVLPEFSSIPAPPDRPLALVLGIGYEYGRAVGLINYLEPHTALCWWAISEDRTFEHDVMKANNGFNFGLEKVEILRYGLADPRGTFIDLESAIYGLSKKHRVIGVPMGPKMFAAVMLMAALETEGRMGVWRLEVVNEAPIDATPGPNAIYFYADVPRLARKVGAVEANIHGA